jgi:hypothetical protein
MYERASRAAVMTLAVLVTCVTAPAAASAAEQSLLSSSFGDPTTTAPVVALPYESSQFMTSGTPCLTAAVDPVASPIPGCDLAAPDPPGQGTLRLTNPESWQGAAVVYDTSFPTNMGLDITFDTYQYGATSETAGDGMSFDLGAAPPTPSTVGPPGGALGYAPLSAAIGAPQPGFPFGYLGIGLDVLGNDTNVAQDGSGCRDPVWATSGPAPNEVTVRGPGNDFAGYCLLSSSRERVPDPMGGSGIPLQGSSRADAIRAVHVVIDPDTGTYTVGIDPTGGTDYTRVAAGALPASYYQPASPDQPGSGGLVSGIPPRLTFAFAASTGEANDVHEVSNVQATTLYGSVPVLTLQNTDSSGGSVAPGATYTSTLVSGVAASSPTSETNTSSVQINEPLPSGESLAALPSGVGWDCSSSTATVVACRSTSDATVAPSGTLSPLTVPITVDPSASGTLAATAQVISPDAATPVSATDTITVERHSVPANLARPGISGTILPGHTISCSTGTWTGTPSRFHVRWRRNGAPIAGARSARYRVRAADEAQGLGCSVVASNSVGSSAETPSPIVLVALPGTLDCPSPAGDLARRKLGPLAIGMSRARARRARAPDTATPHGFDSFCLFGGWGISAGYGSRRLARTVPATERTAVAGRIVLALTSNRFYALQKARPGGAFRSVAHRVHAHNPLHIGAADWYFVGAGPARGVLKVSDGTIEEIGLANPLLTTTRGAERRLIKAFEGI